MSAPRQQYIIATNLLTKFHGDPTINVAFRVLIRRQCFFHQNRIIFELVQDIIGTNFICKFHEDQNVAPRVLTRQKLALYDAQHTMDKMRSQKLTMSDLC
ncbi:hypothetical protein DPMN_010536 [Dreissena polymorpha]|uniref:Uncharacterized protein n=1 Tax=Dreissena polymorpha TaxID=45954 RepID=A0A9D4N2B6_DREPO|nr:hypothetical protein DPMN_010536 [Dreissena polymorpha]